MSVSETVTDETTAISPEDRAALTWLASQPGGAVKMSAAEFGRNVGWSRQKAGRRLDALTKSGLIVRARGVITLNKERTVIRTIIREVVPDTPDGPYMSADKRADNSADTDQTKGRTRTRTKARTDGVTDTGHGRKNRVRTVRPVSLQPQAQTPGQSAVDLPPAEAETSADKAANAPTQTPPPSTHPNTSSRSRFMWPFTRTKAPAKPITDTPSASSLVPAEAHETGVTEHQDKTIEGTFAEHLDGPPVAKGRVIPGSGKGTAVQDGDDDTVPLDALGWALIFGACVLISFGAALAIVSAHVLYPGVPISWFPEFAACMIAAMEGIRLLLIAAATRWRRVAPWWALGFAWIIILFGESVSLIAVNAELHAMHQGDRPAVTAAATSGVVEANAQVDYWKGVLADIDRRIELYETNAGKIVAADTKKGTTKSVQDAKKTTADPKRAQLGEERKQALAKLAAAQSDVGKAAGKAAVVDSEVGVIRRTATLLHVSAETAATYYIAATTMLVGPFAGIMVMFANSRRRRNRKA